MIEDRILISNMALSPFLQMSAILRGCVGGLLWTAVESIARFGFTGTRDAILDDSCHYSGLHVINHCVIGNGGQGQRLAIALTC